MQDFNYLHSNAFEITLELSCCKYPSAQDGTLEKEWENNKQALLAYMEMVNEAIREAIAELCLPCRATWASRVSFVILKHERAFPVRWCKSKAFSIPFAVSNTAPIGVCFCRAYTTSP